MVARENEQGENNPGVKLSKDQVLRIRSLYKGGETTYSRLAQAFGVGTNQIGRIVRQESWRYLAAGVRG